MPYCHTGIRNFTPHEGFYLVDILDAVVDEEDLPVAAHLEVYRLADNIGIEAFHLGLHRIAVGRRRGDAAQVAGSHQRELQSSRYRRGGHRQRIDVGLQLAQLLFHGDTELLLLVNDEQTEIFEVDILAHDAVRPYQDIYLPFLQIFQSLTNLRGSPRPTYIIYLAREILQAFAKGLIVLEGKYCRRHEDGHLLIVRYRFEGSTYGHFGLSKTHIATNQAVHRTVALHICLHVGSGFHLVRRILIDKARLQFVLHEAIRTEGKALLLLSFGIKQDKVAGNIFHFLLRPLLHLFPSTGAELVQFRRLAVVLAFVLR